MSASTTFTFNLFDTIYETDGRIENHVAAANGTDKVIAPGTGGSFDIVLLNQSEVDAEFTIDYTVTNTANIPVKFSVDGGSTWTDSLADVSATSLSKNSTATVEDDPLTLEEDESEAGDETTITVMWKWDFERGTTPHTSEDAADTELGHSGTATLSVEAVITATQVD